MELRLWGLVEVVGDQAVHVVRPPQQAAVLAALAVDAGRHVPTETLLARVWDDEPPAQARRTVHTHLTRLRRLLELAGGAEHGVRLTHRGGGPCGHGRRRPLGNERDRAMRQCPACGRTAVSEPAPHCCCRDLPRRRRSLRCRALRGLIAMEDDTVAEPVKSSETTF